MARDFNGSSDNLNRGVVSTVTNNFTLCAWVNSDDVTLGQGILTNGYDGGAGTGWRIRINASVPLFTFGFVMSITGTTTLSNGTWYHILGVRDAGTSRLYLNGTSEGGTNASAPNVPATYFRVGCNVSSGGVNSAFFNGRIAEAAIWERALTTAEIAALAAGCSPLFFPGSRKFYAPLIGNTSPEPDIVGGANLTVSGTTAASHPRIIYPAKVQTIAKPFVVTASNQRFTLLGIS